MCEPGYYKVFTISRLAFPDPLIHRCEKIIPRTLEYDIFIKPSLERGMNETEKADIYRQFLDKDAGKTLNDAYYYLAQAFSRLGMAYGPSAGVNYTLEYFS